MENSFPLTQHFNSTPMFLAFEKNSLTNSSIKSSKFPNRSAQSLTSKILGIKVVRKVSNFTTCSTMGEASSKMLEWVYESRGVLNLSWFESLDDWDERRVRLANRGWWNISYNLFFFRRSVGHLQKNRHTAKIQVHRDMTRTSTWLDSRQSKKWRLIEIQTEISLKHSTWTQSAVCENG